MKPFTHTVSYAQHLNQQELKLFPIFLKSSFSTGLKREKTQLSSIETCLLISKI